MSGRENNKIAAGILIASLIAMIVGKTVDLLYRPVLNPEKRGYQVANAGLAEPQQSAQQVPAEEEFNIDIKSLMQTASAEAGKSLFVKCAACHNVDKGGPNRVGPNLWDVIGRVKASHEGYNYSAALKGLGGSWDYESLVKFLHKPMQYAKGTKMSFAGFSKSQDAANLVAYLRTLSESPKPLP